MPAIHCQTFQVRFYECDAYGHMQPANYLRRMQEAAFEASAAVGYDFARYDQIGHLWLVRETEIEYLTPLTYGDSVEITTWVADFRRFRSHRVYQFRSRRTGALAAQAITDWVYVKAQSLRPAAIPAEMQTAFFPEGTPPQSPARSRFSISSDPPMGAFCLQQPVAWSDIDMMWHVNNAAYLGYIQGAQMELLAACGWPIERLRTAGLRLKTCQQHIEYRLPAVLGDEIEISTWLVELAPDSVQECFRISRLADGQVLALAQACWQTADPLTDVPHPLPEGLRAALEIRLKA